jgi:hypothetical protein
LRHPADLRIETIRERPPESLDPDAIRTGPPSEYAAPPSEPEAETDQGLSAELAERQLEIERTNQDREVTQT